MVRTYKRKTERQSWSEVSMMEAIKAVKEGNMGYKLAAEKYSVPKTTLARRVKGKNVEAVDSVKYIGGKKTVLPVEMEAGVDNAPTSSNPSQSGAGVVNAPTLSNPSQSGAGVANAPTSSNSSQSGAGVVNAPTLSNPSQSGAGVANAPTSSNPSQSGTVVAELCRNTPSGKKLTDMVGPYEITPPPKAPATIRKERSNVGKTAIITASPYKIELLANKSMQKKNQNVKKSEGKKQKVKSANTKKLPFKRKKGTRSTLDDDDDDEIEVEYELRKQKKLKKKEAKGDENLDDDSDNLDEDPEYLDENLEIRLRDLPTLESDNSDDDVEEMLNDVILFVWKTMKMKTCHHH